MRWLSLIPMIACSAPERHLLRPNALVLADQGRVHVSDLHHKRVVSFDGVGKFQSEFGEPGLGEDQLWIVWALAFDTPGGLILANHRLRALDSQESFWEVKRFEDGRQRSVRALTKRSGEPVGWVEAMERAPGGGWLLADSEEGVLLHFDQHWACSGIWADAPGGEPLDSPKDLRWDGADLWVLEQHAHRVRRLSPAGEEQARFGQLGPEAGQLSFPSALTSCRGRWVAVADMGNRRVQRFDLQGQYMDGFEPQAAGPDQPTQLMDIATDSDCQRLYLVDSKGNRVLVTTPRGELLEVLDTW